MAQGKLSTPFSHAPAAPDPNSGANAVENAHNCIPDHPQTVGAGDIDLKFYEDINPSKGALNTPFAKGLGITNPKGK